MLLGLSNNYKKSVVQKCQGLDGAEIEEQLYDVFIFLPALLSSKHTRKYPLFLHHFLNFHVENTFSETFLLYTLLHFTEKL